MGSLWDDKAKSQKQKEHCLSCAGAGKIRGNRFEAHEEGLWKAKD